VFYRMSRLHFDDDRFGELIAWAESVKPGAQEITGLVFADIARTGPGEGMILAGYEREEDDEIFTAGLRIGLPFFNRNRGERERSRASRDRIVAEKDSLSLSVESEVLRASLAYGQARSTLQLYDDEVLRAQEESLELLQRALEAGEVGIPDVILVQREVVEGREGYLDVRLDLALARAALLASAHLPQNGPLQGATP